MSISEVRELHENGELHDALSLIERLREEYTPEHPEFIKLMLIKSDILITFSRYQEAKRLLNSLINMARRKGDLLTKLDTIIQLAEVYWHIGQLDQAILMIEMGEIDFTKLSNDYPDSVKSLRYAKLKCLKGIYYRLTGEIDLAREYFNESLVEAEIIDDQKFIANVYNLNGVISQDIGDLTTAWNYYIQSFNLRKEIEDQLGIGKSLYNIGSIQEYIGDLENALTNYEEALYIANSLENRRLKAACLGNIGAIYQKRGNFEEAMNNFSKSLAIKEDLENDTDTAWTLYRLLNLLVTSEKSELVPIFMDGLLKLKEKNNQHKLIDQQHKLVLANIKRKRDKTVEKAEAQQLLYEIIDDDVADHELTIDAMLNLTDILLEEFKNSGDPEILAEIELLFSKLQDLVDQQHSYPLLAQLLLLQGKYSVLELNYSKAFSLFEKAADIAEQKGYIPLHRRIKDELQKTKHRIQSIASERSEDTDIIYQIERTERDEKIAQIIKNYNKTLQISQETPVIFMILDAHGKKLYSLRFLKDETVDDDMIESFLKAINRIIDQAFASQGPVERIKHGKYFILVRDHSGFQFVYIFKGETSFNSIQKLDQIIYMLTADPDIMAGLRAEEVDEKISRIDDKIHSLF